MHLSAPASMMLPAFQNVIDMKQAIAEVPHHAVSPALKMAAGSPTPITGITFIPPLNAVPTIVSPMLSGQQKNVYMQAAALLPEYFNWGDPQSVSRTKHWPLRDTNKLGPYLSPLFNQKSCGCCWAVSSSQCLGDRLAIWGGIKNPVLSPTLTLGCVGDERLKGDPLLSYANTAGCMGGFPAAAAALFAKYGTVSQSCSPFNTWCTGECASGSGGTDLNPLIPRCSAQQQQCLGTTADHTLYKAKGGSRALTTIEEIKADIFHDGPVVGAMVVKQDFYVGMPWAATQGVYVNLPPTQTPYAGLDSAKLMGFHAIVVVGWGVEKGVKNWLSGSPATFDIPYWIVRNSWGSGWNVTNTVNNQKKFPMPGYWKHAMRVKVGGVWLNDGIGIDHVVREYGPPIGGCTTFKPDIARVNPLQIHPNNTKDSNATKRPTKPVLKPGSPYASTYTSTQKSWVVGGSVMFLIAIIMFIVLMTIGRAK